MGLFDRSTSFAVGFAAGFGTGVLVRDYVPNLKSIGSPVLKFFLKSGIVAAERSRESLARLGETLQDLMAEAQMELKERKMGPTPHRHKRKQKKMAGTRRGTPVARKSRKTLAVKEAEVIPLHKGRVTT